MASHDPEELWPELDKVGLAEVEQKLAQGVYGRRKKPNVERWIANAREALDARTWMYHPKLATEGKTFTKKEVPELEKNGWFDTPAKFPNTERRDRMFAFLAKEWKWVIGTALVVVGLIIAAIKI